MVQRRSTSSSGSRAASRHKVLGAACRRSGRKSVDSPRLEFSRLLGTHRHTVVLSAVLALGVAFLLCLLWSSSLPPSSEQHFAVGAQATSSPAKATSSGSFRAAARPIEDTTCAVEVVDEANSKQLSLILSALTETLFFRLFKVDMHAKCQYDFKNNRWMDDAFLEQNALFGDSTSSSSVSEREDTNSSSASPSSTTSMTSSSNSEEDDLDDEDDEVDSASPGTPSTVSEAAKKVIAAVSGKIGETSNNSSSSLKIGLPESEHEDSFQCTGPPMLDSAAPEVSQLMKKPGNLMSTERPQSACTVTGEADGFQFGGSKENKQLAASGGSRVDRAKTEEEAEFSRMVAARSCAEDAPEFWLDMCSMVSTRGPDFINLLKNPETNTGYQGRHIWEAMYSENCFSHHILKVNGLEQDEQRAGSMNAFTQVRRGQLEASKKAATLSSGETAAPLRDLNDTSAIDRREHETDGEGMCFEERVLYRLLSGVHSCTSISIYYNYYPPSAPPLASAGSSSGADGAAQAVAPLWGKNPERFMEVFARHPDRLKNLYFAFIVLLRATKKAGNFFEAYKYNTGDAQEDAKIATLMRRLLDSDSLAFCHSAFEGFDEKSMFLSKEVSRREFKRGFQRISALMSCVKCSRCKLHGKLHILGIGAALKILLLTEDLLPTSLSREEIVALFNTLHAFSQALQHANSLLQLYVRKHSRRKKGRRSSAALPDVDMTTLVEGTDDELVKTMEQSGDSPEPSAGENDERDDGSRGSSRGKDRDSSRNNTDSNDEEEEKGLGEVPGSDDDRPWPDQLTETLARLRTLLQTVKDEASSEDVAILRGAQEEMARAVAVTAAAHASSSPKSALKTVTSAASPEELTLTADAVVVGSGLAGMSAALSALQRGASVVMLEKEPRLGGNSGKASSGINGELWEERLNAEAMNVDENVALRSFFHDTMKSGAGRAVPSRVRTLVEQSDDALKWLQGQGVDLGLKAVLGGHSAPRTYRPSTGNFIGTEVILVLERRLREFEAQGKLTILSNLKVEGLLTELSSSGASNAHTLEEKTVSSRSTIAGTSGASADNYKSKMPPRVLGVHGQFATGEAAASKKIRVFGRDGIVLATGGFGHDHSQAGSLLYEHRPDLRQFPTTLGKWTTGDGIRMVLSFPGTRLVDMRYVQVHPTGFVDPREPLAGTKTLAAEVLRGVGGILLSETTGERFCDELGTRQYVVDRMLEAQGQAKEASKPSSASSKKEKQSSTSSSAVESKSGSVRPFFILLGADAQEAASRHIQHYTHKGLLHYFDLTPPSGTSNSEEANEAVAKALGEKSAKKMREKLLHGVSIYATAAEKGVPDAFGKQKFLNIPKTTDRIVVGKIVPVVHYTMGGVEVDDLHRVVTHTAVEAATTSSPTKSKAVRENANAAGNEETSAPVGDYLPDERLPEDVGEADTPRIVVPGLYAVGEIAGGLHGKNRLGGNSLLECLVFGRLVGQRIGDAVAKRQSLARNFDQMLDARLASIAATQKGTGGREPRSLKRRKQAPKDKPLREIDESELQLHNNTSDCWVQLYDEVYDLTVYARIHPGGEASIFELCGQDGTAAFEAIHARSMLKDGGFKALGKIAQQGSAPSSSDYKTTSKVEQTSTTSSFSTATQQGSSSTTKRPTSMSPTRKAAASRQKDEL
ncbi:unnamed protein product [Amoebophrya sp. A25]|nr:unnamed protein product [Amoebophrya sp. A25]|eukprot:GSA25T00011654001.1